MIWLRHDIYLFTGYGDQDSNYFKRRSRGKYLMSRGAIKLLSSEELVKRYFIILKKLYLSAMKIFLMVNKLELFSFEFNFAKWITPEVSRD